MKSMVCEMCGSNDIVKKDGLYVCQFCGTKYSVEDAKKMMIDGTTTLYFIAPKEWLGGLYPEAVSAEIGVEYPVAHPEAIYATVMMSPTKATKNDSVEDYDWYDIVLLQYSDHWAVC